jgi:hypothetical protein
MFHFSAFLIVFSQADADGATEIEDVERLASRMSEMEKSFPDKVGVVLGSR